MAFGFTVYLLHVRAQCSMVCKIINTDTISTEKTYNMNSCSSLHCKGVKNSHDLLVSEDQCNDWSTELFVDYFELRKQAKCKIQVVLT